MMYILHAAPGGFPSHVSTGHSPYHSFVMPIQGMEASYANLRVRALKTNARNPLFGVILTKHNPFSSGQFSLLFFHKPAR